MDMKKRFLGGICALLALSVMVPSVAARTSEEDSSMQTVVASTASGLSAIGNRLGLTALFENSADARNSVNSRIIAGMTLAEEEAALRLYYLDMISGTGVNANGGVDFALDRGLSRLEAAVFAVRLMGAEDEAEKNACAHPYTDVPEWASAYVGYMYNRGALTFNGDRKFHPNGAVTCNEFMSYVLYALGYRITDGDYSHANAASIARKVGICVTKEDEVLTRGGACLAMYNALRATMKDSKKVLSNKLVEGGEISYEDAIFLLWNENKAETETFMAAVGYGKQWIIPDGYYTISTVTGGKRLSSSATETTVTLKDITDDATQSFRLERTERGTYLIYAATSKNGFGHVLGAGGNGGSSIGLCSATAKNAMEYYIEGSVDGTWTILSAKDAKKALTSTVLGTGTTMVSLMERGKATGQTWNIARHGVTNGAGEEMAIFCCYSLSVTQGAYDIYSHQGQNALDIQPTEGYAYAPFHATVVAINPGDLPCNAVWIESISPVKYADGTYDYMTVCFMHDDDISDLYVGKGLKQGDRFYDSGLKGIASGAHIHVSVYKGKYNSNMHIGHGNVNAEDAFYLPDDTYIRNDYGLDWTVVSAAQ